MPKKVLSTTRHIKLIEKKEITAIALDSEYETFVVYVASLVSQLHPTQYSPPFL